MSGGIGRGALRAILVAALLTPLLARAENGPASSPDARPPGVGEIRAYLWDGEGAFVKSPAARVEFVVDCGAYTLRLQAARVAPPAGGSGKAAAAVLGAAADGGTRASAAPQASFVADHLAETTPLGPYRLLLQVEEDRPGLPARPGGPPPPVPFFRATAPLVVYQCSLRHEAPSSHPGRCPRCGMTMWPRPAACAVQVVLHVGGREYRGLGVPPSEAAAPASLRDALAALGEGIASLEDHLHDGTYDEMGGVARDLAAAADRLDRLAAGRSAVSRQRLSLLGKAFEDLREGLEIAASDANAAEVGKILSRYRRLLSSARAAAR